MEEERDKKTSSSVSSRRNTSKRGYNRVKEGAGRYYLHIVYIKTGVKRW